MIGDKSHSLKYHEVAGWQNATPHTPSKIDKIAKCTPLLSDLLRGIMSDRVDKKWETSPKNSGWVLE